MNKLAFFLIMLTLFLAPLSHGVHALRGPSGQAASDIRITRDHQAANVVDHSPVPAHHVLPEIGSQVCSVDQPVALQAASGAASLLASLPTSWHAAHLSWRHAASTCEEPGYPPAVRRALLQVFLN